MKNILWYKMGETEKSTFEKQLSIGTSTDPYSWAELQDLKPYATDQDLRIHITT